jgi:transposase
MNQPERIFKNGRCKYSPEIVRRAVDLFDQGVLQKDIAKQLDVPRGTLASWIHKRVQRDASLNAMRLREEEESEREELFQAREDERREQMMQAMRPPGAEAYSRGLFYKRGRHGKVFYWDNEEWRLSSLSPKEITWSFRGLR